MLNDNPEAFFNDRSLAALLMAERDRNNVTCTWTAIAAATMLATIIMFDNLALVLAVPGLCLFVPAFVLAALKRRDNGAAITAVTSPPNTPRTPDVTATIQRTVNRYHLEVTAARSANRTHTF